MNKSNQFFSYCFCFYCYWLYILFAYSVFALLPYRVPNFETNGAGKKFQNNKVRYKWVETPHSLFSWYLPFYCIFVMFLFYASDCGFQNWVETRKPNTQQEWITDCLSGFKYTLHMNKDFHDYVEVILFYTL